MATTGVTGETLSNASKISVNEAASTNCLTIQQLLSPDFYIDYGADTMKYVVIADISTNFHIDKKRETVLVKVGLSSSSLVSN